MSVTVSDDRSRETHSHSRRLDGQQLSNSARLSILTPSPIRGPPEVQLVSFRLPVLGLPTKWPDSLASVYHASHSQPHNWGLWPVEEGAEAGDNRKVLVWSARAGNRTFAVSVLNQRTGYAVLPVRICILCAKVNLPPCISEKERKIKKKDLALPKSINHNTGDN